MFDFWWFFTAESVVWCWVCYCTLARNEPLLAWELVIINIRFRASHTHEHRGASQVPVIWNKAAPGEHNIVRSRSLTSSLTDQITHSAVSRPPAHNALRAKPRDFRSTRRISLRHEVFRFIVWRKKEEKKI